MSSPPAPPPEIPGCSHPPSDPPDEPPETKTYAAAVGGHQLSAVPLCCDSLIESRRMRISFPDGVRGLAIAEIDSDVIDSLSEKWKTAVIIKVLGRNVAFRLLERRLYQVWRPAGLMTILDLPNGFYAVRFDNEDDFLKALTDGPWEIFGHYITVRPWSADFNPYIDKLRSIFAWARLSDLPMQLYDEAVLYGLASALGTPLKVDLNTLYATRGKFARVCVEIELDKPLIGTILIGDNRVHVVYEGLNAICHRSGLYGHGAERCPLSQPPKSTAQSDPSSSDMGTTGIEQNDC